MSSWGGNRIHFREQRRHIIQQPTINTFKPHYYTKEISFNDTYNSTILKINDFIITNKEALITFVIPSINRYTLEYTLQSLINQSVNNWNAIIIFDGCEPVDTNLLDLLSDKRFLYISINKTGILKDITHGAAGFVRNIAISIVQSQWVGFVDDDDTLTPYYTEKLLEEIEITPSSDLIVFRMIDKHIVYPQAYVNNIELGRVGISFCYKTQLFQKGFEFTQSEQEDFDLLNRIKLARHRITISPYITYLVRNSNVISNNMRRVIIN
jgi:glycosyltransferase involved in cell wall biosynthesis